MVVFCDQQHWDSLHASHRPFEWYSLQYCHIQSWLNKLVPELNASLLHVGVGTSRIQDGMALDGYLNISNIDYSPAVIDIQAKHAKALCLTNNSVCTVSRRCSACAANRYKVDDVTALTFQSASFDVVLDKGTCDGMAASPRPEDCERLVSEAHRVLKPGGVFLMISFGSPYLRGPLLLDTPGVEWDKVMVWTINRSLRQDCCQAQEIQYRSLYIHDIKTTIQQVENGLCHAMSNDPAQPVQATSESDKSGLQFDFSDSFQLTYDMLEDTELIKKYPMNGRTLYAYACYKAG